MATILTMNAHGLIAEPRKTDFGRDLVLLGFEVSITRNECSPGPVNQARIFDAVATLCAEAMRSRSAHLVSARSVQHLAGLAAWASAVIPLARFFTAELHHAVAQWERQRGNRAPLAHDRRYLHLSLRLVEELDFFANVAPAMPALTITPEPAIVRDGAEHSHDACAQLELISEARPYGFGGYGYHFGPHVRYGSFPQTVMRRVKEMGGNPMLILEPEAGLLYTLEFGALNAGCHQVTDGDNTAHIAWWNNGGSASHQAGAGIAKAQAYAQLAFGVLSTRCRYRKSADLKIADFASRLELDFQKYYPLLMEALHDAGYSDADIDIREALRCDHTHADTTDRAYLRALAGLPALLPVREFAASVSERGAESPAGGETLLAGTQGNAINPRQRAWADRPSVSVQLVYGPRQPTSTFRGPYETHGRLHAPLRKGTWPPVLRRSPVFATVRSTRPHLDWPAAPPSDAPAFASLAGPTPPPWFTPERAATVRAHPDTRDLSRHDDADPSEGPKEDPVVATFKADLLRMPHGISMDVVPKATPSVDKLQPRQKQRMAQIQEQSLRRAYEAYRTDALNACASADGPNAHAALRRWNRCVRHGPPAYDEPHPALDVREFAVAWAFVRSLRPNAAPLRMSAFDAVTWQHSCLRDRDFLEAARTLHIVEFGAVIFAIDGPHPPNFRAPPPSRDDPHLATMTAALDKDVRAGFTMLWTDALRRYGDALHHDVPQFVANQFVVSQHDKDRCIWDGSFGGDGVSVNAATHPRSVHLPSVHHQLDVVAGSDAQQFKADVASAYKRVFISPECIPFNAFWGYGRRWLGSGGSFHVESDGQWHLYVGLSLQFGANASPATFQHMSSHIVRIGMRLGRLSSLVYIDDLFGTLTIAGR